MTGTNYQRLQSFSHQGLLFDVADGGTPDGEAIVLLHGFPEMSDSWKETAHIFGQQGFRTISFDQRGYSPGARPRGRFAYRTSALAADVVALVDALGGNPVHLVGHDWGATVAWSVAARHPHLVRTLTTVSVPHRAAFLRSMLSSNQMVRSYYMALFQIPWIPEFVIRMRPRIMSTFLSKSGMTSAQTQQVQDRIIDSGALTGALNWYRAMLLTTPTALLAKVSVPTTHVWGDRDTALARRGAELTENYVTGPYRLEVLAGATHWIPQQNSDEIARIVLEGIARSSPSATSELADGDA